MVQLPECSFPCFLTGIKPIQSALGLNSVTRFPNIVCDQFSKLVDKSDPITISVELPQMRSRLDNSVKSKFKGLVPCSIPVHRSNISSVTTVAKELISKNTALLEHVENFTITLNDSESILTGDMKQLTLTDYKL